MKKHILSLMALTALAISSNSDAMLRTALQSIQTYRIEKTFPKPQFSAKKTSTDITKVLKERKKLISKYQEIREDRKHERQSAFALTAITPFSALIPLISNQPWCFAGAGVLAYNIFCISDCYKFNKRANQELLDIQKTYGSLVKNEKIEQSLFEDIQ